jgi:hypothetical protein
MLVFWDGYVALPMLPPQVVPASTIPEVAVPTKKVSESNANPTMEMRLNEYFMDCSVIVIYFLLWASLWNETIQNASHVSFSYLITISTVYTVTMRKKVMLVVILLIVLVIGFSATKFFSSQSQKSAVQTVSDTFISDTLGRKPTESYALFTSDEKSKLDKSIWATQVNFLSSFFAGKSPNLQSNDGTESLRFLTYKVAGADGTYNLVVTLAQQDTSWQVQSFTSTLEGQ